jgi:hypothetical protein
MCRRVELDIAHDRQEVVFRGRLSVSNESGRFGEATASRRFFFGIDYVLADSGVHPWSEHDRYGEEIARMKQAEVALKQALSEVKRASGDAVLQDIKVGPNFFRRP